MNRGLLTRDRILAVARQLFSRHPYEGVSLRDITAQAKVNLGAVPYYFGSKAALYTAAIDSLARPFVEAIAAAARGPGDALDQIEAVTRVILTVRQPAPTAVLRELASQRPLPAAMTRIMRRNLDILVGLVRAGQRDGSVRTGDPQLLALNVVTHQFFLRVAGPILQQVFGIDRRDPKVQARIVAHVVESVRRGLARRPGGKA